MTGIEELSDEEEGEAGGALASTSGEAPRAGDVCALKQGKSGTMSLRGTPGESMPSHSNKKTNKRLANTARKTNIF